MNKVLIFLMLFAATDLSAQKDTTIVLCKDSLAYVGQFSPKITISKKYDVMEGSYFIHAEEIESLRQGQAALVFSDNKVLRNDLQIGMFLAKDTIRLSSIYFSDQELVQLSQGKKIKKDELKKTRLVGFFPPKGQTITGYREYVLEGERIVQTDLKEETKEKNAWFHLGFLFVTLLTMLVVGEKTYKVKKRYWSLILNIIIYGLWPASIYMTFHDVPENLLPEKLFLLFALAALPTILAFIVGYFEQGLHPVFKGIASFLINSGAILFCKFKTDEYDVYTIFFLLILAIMIGFFAKKYKEKRKQKKEEEE